MQLSGLLFVCLFYSSIHIEKEKCIFTREAQFEKDKTTVWIKWPTHGRATYTVRVAKTLLNTQNIIFFKI